MNPIGLRRLVAICATLLTAGLALGQIPTSFADQARTHPMRYFVVGQPHRRPGKTLGVVIAIESADRDFGANANTFWPANDPNFIIVIPEVITNGGPGYRQASGYHYTPAEWERIERDGPWKFDQDGIDAILADIHQEYGGDGRYYLTGWEAGAHTAFALAFSHPERIRALAAVCPNYAGRNVSLAGSKNGAGVPIRVFGGSNDPSWRPGKPLYEQAKRAESEARKRGFTVSETMVRGGTHGPLALAVMDWFATLRSGRKPTSASSGKKRG